MIKKKDENVVRRKNEPLCHDALECQSCTGSANRVVALLIQAGAPTASCLIRTSMTNRARFLRVADAFPANLPSIPPPCRVTAVLAHAGIISEIARSPGGQYCSLQQKRWLPCLFFLVAAFCAGRRRKPTTMKARDRPVARARYCHVKTFGSNFPLAQQYCVLHHVLYGYI